MSWFDDHRPQLTDLLTLMGQLQKSKPGSAAQVSSQLGTRQQLLLALLYPGLFGGMNDGTDEGFGGQKLGYRLPPGVMT